MQACERHLAHILPGSGGLLHYKVASEICRLMDEETFASVAEREHLREQCEQIRVLPEWPALIEARLHAGN